MSDVKRYNGQMMLGDTAIPAGFMRGMVKGDDYDALLANSEKTRIALLNAETRLQGMTFDRNCRMEERDQLRAELDAIRGQPSAALIEATRELISAAQSVNRSKAHEVRGLADEQPCYWQRKEWIDWFVENGEKARKALGALPPQQPDAVSVPREELEALRQDAKRFRFVVDCPIRTMVALGRMADQDPNFDLAKECDAILSTRQAEEGE